MVLSVLTTRLGGDIFSWDLTDLVLMIHATGEKKPLKILQRCENMYNYGEVVLEDSVAP